MTPAEVQLVMETLKMALLLSAPVVIGALLTGFAMGVAQAATSVQDPSIGSVPKVVVTAGVLLVTGPWVIGRLVEFSLVLLSDLGRFVH